MTPSAIHGAKSHDSATVHVAAVLRVHVEWVFALTLAKFPNVVEASDVLFVSGNNLRIETITNSEKEAEPLHRYQEQADKKNPRNKIARWARGEIVYHAKLGSGQIPVFGLVAHFPGSHHPV
jgi:hypothetical protein